MQEINNNNFEISIKDNFFDNILYEKILNHLKTVNWLSDYNVLKLKTGHLWFSSPLNDPDIKNYITEKIKDYFNKEIISFRLINYTLVTKLQNPVPHNDASETVNYQLLIYLKGDEKLHNGIGFYIEKENNFILNTHIGFKENRAIFFKSGTTHSPLTWQEDSSKRFSIICQFLIKEVTDAREKK
jgi:hypothetical protein